jgi:hypothetical protein
MKKSQLKKKNPTKYLIRKLHPKRILMLKYYNNQNQKRNNEGFYNSISLFFFLLLLLLNSPVTSAGIGSVSGPSIQLDVVEYVIGIERRAKLADGTPIQEYDRVELLENSTPPTKDGTQVNIKLINISKVHIFFNTFALIILGNFI